MSDIRINDFEALSGVEWIRFDQVGPAAVQEVNTDTRTLRPGQVFWALVGERFDAHTFLKEAEASQPRFMVVQKDRASHFNGLETPLAIVPDTLKALQELAALHRVRFDIPLLGLTGSNGKTTTKEMIAHLLSAKWNVLRTAGNFNNHIGLPLTLLQLGGEHEAAVIEMGTNHPGEIALLTSIAKPDRALVTNVGTAHLEFFKSKEKVAEEKLALFNGLSAGSRIYQNLDDFFISRYQNENLKAITYAAEQPAQIQVKLQKVDRSGRAVFILNGSVEIHLQVPGVHNIQNALAAAAVALDFGMSEVEVKAGLESFTATDNRMQTMELGGVTFINDAYNSNPDSAVAALHAVGEMQVAGRRWICLGDMLELGAVSLKEHKRIVQQALSVPGATVLLLGETMHSARNSNREARWFENHSALAQVLKESLRPGDLVLLKGSRGMQMEKILDYFK